MRLRRKLFVILSFMTLVPFMVLLFVVVGNVEQDMENQLQADLLGRLDNMSKEVTTLLDSQKSLVKGLSKVPAIRQFAEVSIAENHPDYRLRANELESFFLNYQIVVPSIQALRFIDPDGKTLVKVKEGLEIAPKYLDPGKERYYIADQSSKQFFKYARANNSVISLSDFELGKVTQEADFCPAMIRYSVPIKDEVDNFQGFLVVNMWGTRIDETVESALGALQGNVYIVEINDQTPERDGIYLYHKDTNQRFANQLGSEYLFHKEHGNELWKKISREDPKGSVVMDDGRMFFYSHYRPYKDRDSKWVLLIEASRDVIFAPIIHLKKYIWIIMLILVLLSIMLTRWVSQRMAKPVNTLANKLTQYADGNKSIRYDDERSDEIGAAGRAFNYLCQSLELTEKERDRAESSARQSERLAAVGQLAAGIGHEINNPLMNIMSLAELIQQSAEKGDKNEMLDDLKTLQQEGHRCSRIVQGILNFARANEPSYQEFNMADLITDTLKLMHHHFDKKSLVVKTEIDRPLLMEGDSGQLQQVLVNILLNAVYSSPENSTITVSARNIEGVLRLNVMDQGKGIDEEDMHRIFNPFFSTKPEGEGSGLGLSVSYGIIRKHGGSISLENRLVGGVNVQISLPIRAMKNEAVKHDEVKSEQTDELMEKRVAG